LGASGLVSYSIIMGLTAWGGMCRDGFDDEAGDVACIDSWDTCMRSSDVYLYTK